MAHFSMPHLEVIKIERTIPELALDAVASALFAAILTAWKTKQPN
jgi:hypothetical protein